MQFQFKLVIILIFSILLLPMVLSSSAVLDKESYSLTETSSSTFNCAGNEKNQNYVANWTNGTFSVQTNTGNTGDCTTFLHSFIINSTYIDAYGNQLYINLSGTNLEIENGDNATITTAGSNILLISSITHQGTFLGLSSSIDSNVADENGKAISGGFCDANVEDPSNDQVLFTIKSTMIDGNLDFIWFLDYERFKEKKDYVAKISCFCGSTGSIYECIDEDGLNVNNSIGSSDVAFETSEWITFNDDPFPLTLENTTREATQLLFAGFDDIHWSRNVSNNNPDLEPIEVKTRTILVKNDTKQIFGKVNEGTDFGDLDGFSTANSTSFRNHKLTQLADSGVYFIRIIYDVIYKNQFQVAQYIKSTDPFNITSIKDTFQLNNVSVDDFFGKMVTTNSSTLKSTSLPISNQSDNQIVLSEGFKFSFCTGANNTRVGEDITLYVHSLILENPTTGFSQNIISEEVLENEVSIIYEENVNETRVCFTEIMPDPVPTHSDYRFHFEIHIGTADEEFLCGEACDFEGESDFFYVGKDEDMIPFTKFHRTANLTDLGNPGVFIMTERGEFLNMFDDANYTTQEDIDWFNSTQRCNKKDDPTNQFLCDYSVHPRAGERIKVCMEARSFYSSEVFIELFDIYLDNDVGDSVIQLKPITQSVENGLKYIGDTDLYVADSVNRAREADGKLLDGYNPICTDWLQLPDDIVGGDNWDVQGKARLSRSVYGLKEDVVWNWESDEFPIYGLIQSEPTWDLHLFEPIHYRIPEKWNKLSSTSYTFNFNISYLGPNAQSFNFGEHLPFRLLDENAPLERIVNVTVSYANGTEVPLDTELSSQFGEIILIINNVNLSLGDNNFTISVQTLDLANRSVAALESIADKTGTFRAVIDCPIEGTLGKEINCVLTVQLEETQLVKEEAGFTCFLLKSGVRHSTKKFERQVTKEGFSETVSFLIPSSFGGNSQARAECKVVHYDLGGREDTIFDSFLTKLPEDSQPASAGGGGVPVEPSVTAIESALQAVLDLPGKVLEVAKRGLPLLLIVTIIVTSVLIAVNNQKVKKKRRNNGIPL